MFLYQRLPALSRLYRSKFLRPLIFSKTSLNVDWRIFLSYIGVGAGGGGVSMDKAANYFEMACAPLQAPPIILSVPRLPPQPLPDRGRGSSIGSVFAWHASGPEFDFHIRHILSWRFGHENISTAILPLPLIQEEQLSVTGERMCTKYW